jgi:hypothetical protein
MLMQLSCGCCELSAVTIKGMDKADGATIWEFGPGSFWRHHYGSDAISGIVPDLSATLNRYVLAANTGSTWQSAGDRAAGLSANAAECLTLHKLDSLDGTTIESAALEGMFVASISANGSFAMFNGLDINETAALSGGDYVIAGRRVPVVEFEDFTSNTANKDYVLYGHNQRTGNVYFRTRTSSEIVTLPYNASASAVAAAFAATADCTSATATGGPWPLAKINLSCTWSVAGGDISAIRIDSTATATTPGTGTSFYKWDGSVWNLLNDSCTTGSPQPPSFPGTVLDEEAPGTCQITGTGTVPTEGAATTYSTSTGEILNTVGRIFGASTSITAQKLIAAGASVPTVTVNANENIFHMVSGPSDTLGIIGTGFRYIEAWTPGTTWSNNWQKFANAIGGAAFSSPRLNLLGSYSVEQGKLLVNFQNRLYAGTYKAAAHIDMTSGTVTELANASYSISTVNLNNTGETYLLENDSSKKIEYPQGFRNQFNQRVYLFGVDTNVDGDEFFLGRNFHIGTDATNIYGTAIVHNNTPQFRYEYYGTTTTTTNSRPYFWRFRTVPGSRFTNATEFRLRFTGGVTAWLAWTATLAEIKTAILGVYPENTEGVVSNATLPWASTAAILPLDNDYVSHLERGLEIEFRGFANPAGAAAGYITPSHLTGGRITIETRNAVAYNPAGIVAWSRSGGSVAWSRTWGVPLGGGTELQYPQYAWSRGDFVYAYGQQVENDL